MRNIETEILALKQQIAYLEETKRLGYTIQTYPKGVAITFTPYDDATVIQSADKGYYAIIFNEQMVRAYLAEKDAMKRVLGAQK